MLAKSLKALVLKVDSCDIGVTGHIQYSTVNIASHEVDDYRAQLMDIRKYLECKYVEHLLVRTANGDRFDLWLDEISKLNNNKCPCLPVIFEDHVCDTIIGNVLVTRCDLEGNIIALTDEDINVFLEYLKECWKIACAPHESMLNLVQA